MSELTDLAQFMYGNVRTNQGFWYSHQLREVEGLTDEQLFWVPAPNSMCILWHAGHIAHRERSHIGLFLQGLEPSIIPAEFEVFGTEWVSAEEVRRSIPSIQNVFDWVREVRLESSRYIASLKDEDLFTVPFTSEGGMTIAQWLFITTCHTALHIGRIQLLRAMIEGKPERVC
jgi:hypothetical protein